MIFDCVLCEQKAQANYTIIDMNIKLHIHSFYAAIYMRNVPSRIQKKKTKKKTKEKMPANKIVVKTDDCQNIMRWRNQFEL